MNIVQKMVDDQHFYWVDGEFMPSVTHILDVAAPKEFGLINFFKQNTPEEIDDISTKAKDNGSLVHDSCEKLLNGVEVPIKDFQLKAKKALMSFTSWYDTFKPTKMSTEQMVASKKYKYAGTLDLVCNLGGKRVLVDFKTNKSSIYFTNKLQVMAYKQAYEETSGEKIDECYILRLGTTHKIGYEYKLIDEVDIKDFMNVYQTYLRINGGKIEEPPMIDVYPDTLKLDL
jgi:CRISPR/Cas system-associated exonuclease Cas4 (RecB family)